MKNFNLNLTIEKLNALNAALFVIMVATSITSMYFSNNLASKGAELSHIEDRTFALETENQYLYSKYYRQIALENISAKAAESGLSKASVDFYTSPSFASR